MRELSWKHALADRMPDDLSAEIDSFEALIEQKKLGKVNDKVFAESRLRRGTYGQRFDNGQRFDGQVTKHLPYPSGDLLKGPDTIWDAPGMQRIKIPFGGLNAAQMDVLANIAEEYSDNILHITTRQDIQLHYVHIEDTPDLMRRLASVGITTREACGNVVRNVTACPVAGVCRTETFDVTPYAKALSRFLLGHPDCQDMGRKFKIAFSGCRHEACGLTTIHDIGALAVTREENGQPRRGFTFFVGGGLGAVPYQAQLFEEFLPEEELLPTAQAICRVFARLGEKNNRARARMKFLVDKLGLDEFKRLVAEERKILPHDDQWTAYLEDVAAYGEAPLKIAAPLNGAPRPEGFDRWHETNGYKQRQNGYTTVTVTLPLGDLTAHQMRGLADLARKYVKDTVRTTVEQNVVFRWVSDADVPAFYAALQALGLAEPDAGTIVDVVACPGTDTCKLGISSSRGLAGELRTRLAAQSMSLDRAIKNLRIKISGCFNSCGQHHIADLGFYGNSRKINGYTVPHFQVVLGGQWTENAASYGLAVGAVPSKNIPDVVTRMTEGYVQNRKKDETFQDYIKRIGKKQVKEILADLTQVPPHDLDPSYYTDWGDSREFTTGDMGKGECAGEVVSLVQFELSACETEAFEAQIQLDEGNFEAAYKGAFSAMFHAAKALVRTQWFDVPDDAAVVVKEFRTRFCDTELFNDRFAGAKFANYFFNAYEAEVAEYTRSRAHTLVEETQLFIEAVYACYGRMNVVTA